MAEEQVAAAESPLHAEQVIYAQLEDAEDLWKHRNPNSPNEHVRVGGVKAVTLCKELSELFRKRAEDREFELAKYDEECVWGE